MIISERFLVDAKRKMAEQKLKVLNILHDERFGGPQNRVLSVAKRLRDEGIETVIVLPKGEKDFSEMARKDGFKVYQVTNRLGDPKTISGVLRNINFILSLPLVVFQLSRIIKREEIDIVHNNASINISGFLAALINQTKLVWHLNDVGTPEVVRKIISLVIARYADRIVVASRAVANYYFDSRNVRYSVVYPPIEVDKFSKDISGSDNLRREFNLQEGEVIVGCVGNVNPEKGLEYFVDSAALIKNSNTSSFKFLIVGGVLDSQKEYYGKLKNLQEKLGLDSDLVFTGFRNDIPEILKLFDVFVLPSVSEGCPIALLEAMASKLPVVATNVGGVPEVINGKAGLLVSARDSEDIAENVDYFLENPKEKVKVGIQGKKRVEKAFSLDNCVKRHKKVYTWLFSNLIVFRRKFN